MAAGARQPACPWSRDRPGRGAPRSHADHGESVRRRGRGRSRCLRALRLSAAQREAGAARRCSRWGAERV